MVSPIKRAADSVDDDDVVTPKKEKKNPKKTPNVVKLEPGTPKSIAILNSPTYQTSPLVATTSGKKAMRKTPSKQKAISYGNTPGNNGSPQVGKFSQPSPVQTRSARKKKAEFNATMGTPNSKAVTLSNIKGTNLNSKTTPKTQKGTPKGKGRKNSNEEDDFKLKLDDEMDSDDLDSDDNIEANNDSDDIASDDDVVDEENAVRLKAELQSIINKPVSGKSILKNSNTPVKVGKAGLKETFQEPDVKVNEISVGTPKKIVADDGDKLEMATSTELGKRASPAIEQTPSKKARRSIKQGTIADDVSVDLMKSPPAENTSCTVETPLKGKATPAQTSAKEIATPAKSSAKGMATPAKTPAKGMATPAKTPAKGMTTPAKTPSKGMATPAKTPSKGMATPAKTPAKEPPTLAKTPAKEPPTLAKTPAKEPPTLAKTPAKEPHTLAKTPAKEPPTLAKTPAEEPPTLTKTPAKKPLTLAKTPAKELPTLAKTPAKELPTLAKTPAKELPTLAKTPAKELPTLAKTPAKEPLTLAKTPAKELPTLAKTPAKEPLTLAKTPAKEPLTLAKTPAKEPLTLAKTPAKEPPTMVKTLANETLTPVKLPAKGTPPTKSPTKEIFSPDLSKGSPAPVKTPKSPPVMKATQKKRVIVKTPSKEVFGSVEEVSLQSLAKGKGTPVKSLAMENEKLNQEMPEVDQLPETASESPKATSEMYQDLLRKMKLTKKERIARAKENLAPKELEVPKQEKEDSLNETQAKDGPFNTKLAKAQAKKLKLKQKKAEEKEASANESPKVTVQTCQALASQLKLTSKDRKAQAKENQAPKELEVFKVDEENSPEEVQVQDGPVNAKQAKSQAKKLRWKQKKVEQKELKATNFGKHAQENGDGDSQIAEGQTSLRKKNLEGGPKGSIVHDMVKYLASRPVNLVPANRSPRKQSSATLIEEERAVQIRRKLLDSGKTNEEIDRDLPRILVAIKKRVEGTRCHRCRNKGHMLRDCPATKVKQPTKCYKCGETVHTSKNCHIKEEVYTHAECFICHQTGHLTNTCPSNKNGIYPRGGACYKCGDKTHLSKSCPRNTRVKDENDTSELIQKKAVVGVLNVKQSADADVTHEPVLKTNNTALKQGDKKRVVTF